MPLTKEVTHGIVRPGGKEVSRIADKYSDDASRDKVQVRLHISTKVLSRCHSCSALIYLSVWMSIFCSAVPIRMLSCHGEQSQLAKEFVM